MKIHVRRPRLKRRSSRSEIGHLKSELFGGAVTALDGADGNRQNDLSSNFIAAERELSRPNRVQNWTRHCERPGIRRSRAVGRSESSKEVLDSEARSSRQRRNYAAGLPVCRYS